MFPGNVAAPYARRHRRKVIAALRHGAAMLLAAVLVLALTAAPTLLGWWDTALPAAIGTAIFALILLSILVMLPLELIAYVDLHFDRPVGGVPFPGLRFGRRLYQGSGLLDAMAREAGLAPLSEFESHDALDTGEPPLWFAPRMALPTVEHLLARLDSRPALRRELQHVQSALQAAEAQGASFYFLLHTRAGMTNAEIHARRSANPAATRPE